MMNIKISEMPQATSVGGDDIIPIVQGGVSKQTTKKTLNTYSTTEQVVGTWIDGKPLYRCVIKQDNIALSNGKAVVGQLADGNVEDMVRMTWRVGRTQGDFAGSRSGYLNSTFYSGVQFVNNDGITIFAAEGGSTTINFIGVFEYTKTTDSAS